MLDFFLLNLYGFYLRLTGISVGYSGYFISMNFKKIGIITVI